MSLAPAREKSEAAILARLVAAGQDNLSRAAAEYLLSFGFDEADTERMNHLATLAREGILTEADRTELDSYLHVGNLLAVMQSKARRALRMLDVRG